MAKGKPGTGKLVGRYAYYKLSKQARAKLGPLTDAVAKKLAAANAAERAKKTAARLKAANKGAKKKLSVKAAA